MTTDDTVLGERASDTVIALVCSTGGLQAVQVVLGDLPADLAAAVIVLVHQQPDRLSFLAEILARSTALRVAVARDGMVLDPGQVLVIGPGVHLLVLPNLRVRVIEAGAFPPNRPSADLLLSTLATAAGPRSIAVVLSGSGHDGATGATAIHRCGGTVVASDGPTSLDFGMPGATIERDDIVDHVVPLDQIGALLARLVSDRR